MSSLHYIIFFVWLRALHALNLTNCGTTKSCIFRPEGCSSSVSNCLVFTYAYNSEQNSFVMEISGGAGSSTQYVGVAFSPTGEMSNSDLYYCTGTELKSAVITGRVTPTDDSLPNGLRLISAQTTNGVAECTFERPAQVIKTISNVPTTFDLSTNQFHVLQAFGDIRGMVIQYHRNRYYSGPYNFTTLLNNSPPVVEDGTVAITNSPPVGDDGTGCGTSRTCFRHPGGCSPGENNCKFLSWSYDPGANTFDFEIVGGTSGYYAAIAFGSSTRMENADLYYCTESGFFSGAITNQNREPPPPDSSLPEEITNVNRMVVNGALSCSFTRAASVTKTITSGQTDFNLVTTEYFLLYAVGISSNNGLSYHMDNKVSSDASINFVNSSGVSGSSNTHRVPLMKAHASLMIIAWITCASMGVILARHFKPLWPDYKLCGKPVWFQLHRALMVTVLLCTIVAFIFIFVAVENFSNPFGTHQILGMIVTVLAILNPLMALFRPHPGEPRRPIFNWAHWFVGSTARVLALVAIFFGVDLTSLDLPEWDTYVLASFVVLHVIVEIVLEILSAVHGHIAVYKKPGRSDVINLDGTDKDHNNVPPTGALPKYIVLLFYFLANLAYLIVFLYFIANN